MINGNRSQLHFVTCSDARLSTADEVTYVLKPLQTFVERPSIHLFFSVDELIAVIYVDGATYVLPETILSLPVFTF